MKRQTVLIGLMAVVVLQAAVLAGEYLGAVYPLWTGRAVRLKTMPIDPRSLFRGNYARLNYEISRIPTADLGEKRMIRGGEVVYVLLKPADDGIYDYAGASLTRPQSGLFLRGRVEDRTQWFSRVRGDALHIRYGIEAYFAPKQKAMELERKLAHGGVAVVMIASNGKAALKDVLAPASPAAE